MKYAIINILNYVCDIVESETEPYYPPTESGITFRTIQCNDSIDVRVNMKYDPDTKTFSEEIEKEDVQEITPIKEAYYSEAELMAAYREGVESVG